MCIRLRNTWPIYICKGASIRGKGSQDIGSRARTAWNTKIKGIIVSLRFLPRTISKDRGSSGSIWLSRSLRRSSLRSILSIPRSRDGSGWRTNSSLRLRSSSCYAFSIWIGGRRKKGWEQQPLHFLLNQLMPRHLSLHLSHLENQSPVQYPFQTESPNLLVPDPYYKVC